MSFEKIGWTVDESSIVRHLIESQNGTVSAAISELIMNLIDKGADKCDIFLSRTDFKVTDNGVGFKDRADVENHFGCFGKKHEDGDAVFGRFRIGRGQIMALSAATWHSHEFKMVADYKHNPECFELETNSSDFVDGCVVSGKFYKELGEYDLLHEIRTLCERIKYLKISIRLNGNTVTEDVDSIKWDYEDDHIFIRYHGGQHGEGVSLYSNGIFVKEISSYVFGLQGDVVTKKPLDLNMSRNEVNANDSTFSHISNVLRREAHKNAKRKNEQLSEGQRRAFISHLLTGELELNEALSICLLKDTRGHVFSIRTLLGRKIPLTIANDNDPLADRIASSKAATVLNYAELAKWGVTTGEDLVNVLSDLAVRCVDQHYLRGVIRSLKQISLLEFNKLTQGLSSSSIILKTRELSPRQRCARNAIQYAGNVMAGRIANVLEKNVFQRKIMIGQSDVAHGWTDGLSYIAIDERNLELLDSGEYGFDQLSLLLLHEYCHDESDLETHGHTPEFYEKFHELSMTMSKKLEVVGHTSSSMKLKYASEIGKNLLEDSAGCGADKFEISTYQVTLAKKNGLSALANDLFKSLSSENRFKLSKKSNIITITERRRHQPGFSIIKELLKIAAKDGFKSSEFDYENAHQMAAMTGEDVTYNLLRDKHLLELADGLSGWAKEKGHCVEAVRAVVLGDDRYGEPMNAMANFLVDDSCSSVSSVELMKSMYDEYRLISKFFDSDISTKDLRILKRGSYGGVNKRDLIESRVSRLGYVSKMVECALKTLKNPDELEVAIENIRSDSFKGTL